MMRFSFTKMVFSFLTLLMASSSILARKVQQADEITKQIRSDFQDRKFGIFIHWGIYSMLASGEWVMYNRRIDRDEYSKLAGGFYPSRFDAKEWTEAFRNAGAQYVTFTSRHHDGFSMWDSQASGYNVVQATPFKRDIVAELAKACKEDSLVLNLYYSHMDWYRTDYPLGSTSKDLPHDSASTDWPSYFSFMNQQLTELLTHYGPIGAIWFDGFWDHGRNSGFDWHLNEQYGLIKRLQPRCMIGNNHHGSPFPGEDFQLFEQDLPGQNNAGFSGSQEVSSRLPLETCMTMNNTWGYHITDKGYKSGDEIIRQLVRAAGMNANYLLNIGPRPDGKLPDEALGILSHVGKFMQRYSASIYGTRGGIVPPQPWGVTTQKKKNIYLHVLNKVKDGSVVNEGLEKNSRDEVTIFLPLQGHVISHVHRFGDEEVLRCKKEKEGYRITLPAVPTEVDMVLEAHLR